MTKSYDAVFFDVGETLLRVYKDPQVAAVQSVAHLAELTVEQYRAGVEQAVAEWRASGGGPESEDLPETWIRHNRRALELAGFAGDVTVAARHMEDTFLADGFELYPDVLGALESLRSARYRLGVISNWPVTLESALKKTNLRSFFSVIVGSGDVGYTKPHPQIFRVALDRMRVTADRALYVGDSPRHDVDGARSVGLEVVLIDREERYPSVSPRISSLSELPDLISKSK